MHWEHRDCTGRFDDILNILAHDAADWDRTRQEISRVFGSIRHGSTYFHVNTAGPSSPFYNRHHTNRPEAAGIVMKDDEDCWQGYVFSRNKTSHQSGTDFYHVVKLGRDDRWDRPRIDSYNLCLPVSRDARPSHADENPKFYRELLEVYEPGGGNGLPRMGGPTASLGPANAD